MNRSARAKYFLVGLCIGLVALVAPTCRYELELAKLTVFQLKEFWYRERFDSERWQANVRTTNEWPYSDKLPIRLRMVDDLLRGHDFKGWSREAVTNLLGAPDQTRYFNDWDFVYYLGPGRFGDAIGDSEWLMFRFDTAGRVKDYRIDHD